MTFKMGKSNKNVYINLDLNLISEINTKRLMSMPLKENIDKHV